MNNRLPPDAFDFYAGLGPTRSYQAVADHFEVSKRSVTRRAVAEKWSDRVATIDTSARQKATQTLQETLEDMNVRHLKMAKFLQNKALEALRGIPITKAMEAVRTLDLSLRAERAARGEPDESSARDVEAIIKREYERWMVEDEEVADANKGSAR